MANQRREYEDFEQLTVGFKAYGWQARSVHAAASKQKLSTSEWLERVIMAATADTLGVTLASLEPRKAMAPQVRAAKPENAAKAARLNASVLDLQAQLKSLLAAAQALSVDDIAEAPAPHRPSRRR